MSIQGIQPPKFTGMGDPDYETHYLNYMVITRDEEVPEVVENRSPLTGNIEVISLGYRYYFEVRMNLFKFADPAAQYLVYRKYDLKHVELFKHGDGDSFVAPGETAPLSFFVTMQRFYLEQKDFRDGLIIKFRSKKYIDPLKGIVGQTTAQNIKIDEPVKLPSNF